MFDEGEHLLSVCRKWSSNCSVCQAISRFGCHLRPAWHIFPRSHVFSFSHPEAGIYFVTLVYRWNVGDFLFTTCLFIVFLAVFNCFFFLYRKISILRKSDIMLTMRSAHCICFYGFKQDQLTLTIFNSITNYIFSLLKAIYSVVFAFVCHHFWKIYKKLNSETLTFSSH